MGGNKALIDEMRELRGMAMQVALEAGLLKECEYHPGIYYEGGSELQQAYRFANSQISARKVELPEGVSRKDFTDAIKSVYDDNSLPDECSICEKHMCE